MKYNVVSVGWCEDGVDEYIINMEFNNVKEMKEMELLFVGGMCGLVNCGYYDDEDIVRYESKGEWFENVKKLVDDVFEDSDKNEVVFDFVEKYGEMVGVRWLMEYDDNVMVMLKGDWWELRDECKEEMKRRNL